MLIIAPIGALGGNTLSSTVSRRLGADLRSALFGKVQRLFSDGLSKFETASLLGRPSNDVAQMQKVGQRLMRVFGRAPLLAVGAVVMAVCLSPRLASAPAVASFRFKLGLLFSL